MTEEKVTVLAGKPSDTLGTQRASELKGPPDHTDCYEVNGMRTEEDGEDHEHEPPVSFSCRSD